jgi:phosphate transport system permease protein
MIIPLITSMMRDVLKAVPPMLREAAYGVGLNRWQVVFYVLRHYARAGLLGSMVLGLGRALGETMAVTFVIGNAHGMPKSLMMPGTTISSVIANEYANASSPLYFSSLIELALILLVISFMTLWASRSILKRGSATRGGSQ